MFFSVKLSSKLGLVDILAVSAPQIVLETRFAGHFKGSWQAKCT